MALPRVGYRLWHQLMQERQFGIIKDQKLNIIVCGVSPQSIAISNLLRDGFNYARVIGMAVGTRHMVGREIHGFKVLGTYADLDVLHKRYNVDQVWYGSNIDDDSKKAVNSWCISNEVEAVSMLNQPGFRRLISLQAGDHASVGIGAGSAKETSRPEVAA
jgi:FlaA1/EpsC-like NDP-sugar epimerase